MINYLKKKGVYKYILLVAFIIAIIYQMPVKSEKAVANSSKSLKILNVAAASDLQSAFSEIGQGFEKKYGIKVIFNFESTGLLVRQIENGAPVDIFASASIKYLNSLDEKKLLVHDSVQRFARGKLALVYKNKNLNMQKSEELLKRDIKNIAVANPKHAPYGEAARQFLKNKELWPTIQDKLIYGNNVRDTLGFVKTGNAEAGLVALSLVINDNDVSYILLDENYYSPVEQGVAIVKKTKFRPEAEKFIDYLNSEEAQNILQKYGYLTE